METSQEWETVIGLEIHTQLATKSKIFSGAATAYGAAPNTQACAVDLGLPGVLPVLNEQAVTMAVKFGLAIDAEIAPYSVFARKNYFYPDLPKGYQISQFELPIVGNGHIDIEVDGITKRIGITRAHLEEDAGQIVARKFSWYERYRLESRWYTIIGDRLRTRNALCQRGGGLYAETARVGALFGYLRWEYAGRLISL